MKGAEQVCVCFEGKQVDAAGEESSTMLSVTGWRFLRGASRYVQYDDTALLPGSTIATVLRLCFGDAAACHGCSTLSQADTGAVITIHPMALSA